jgi:hypothetical protein
MRVVYAFLAVELLIDVEHISNLDASRDLKNQNRKIRTEIFMPRS